MQNIVYERKQNGEVFFHRLPLPIPGLVTARLTVW